MMFLFFLLYQIYNNYFLGKRAGLYSCCDWFFKAILMVRVDPEYSERLATTRYNITVPFKKIHIFLLYRMCSEVEV